MVRNFTQGVTWITREWLLQRTLKKKQLRSLFEIVIQVCKNIAQSYELREYILGFRKSTGKRCKGCRVDRNKDILVIFRSVA